VIDLGRLSGDTIADRRWRIVPDAGPTPYNGRRWVPGGWMNVHREPTISALRRFGLWLGLTIDPSVVPAVPLPIVA
jgi:hypothetical protein